MPLGTRAPAGHNPEAGERLRGRSGGDSPHAEPDRLSLLPPLPAKERGPRRHAGPDGRGREGKPGEAIVDESIGSWVAGVGKDSPTRHATPDTLMEAPFLARNLRPDRPLALALGWRLSASSPDYVPALAAAPGGVHRGAAVPGQ